MNDNGKNLYNNEIKDIKPFEIDFEIARRKRNHWNIENDILKNLYGKEDVEEIKIKKQKKK